MNCVSTQRSDEAELIFEEQDSSCNHFKQGAKSDFFIQLCGYYFKRETSYNSFVLMIPLVCVLWAFNEQEKGKKRNFSEIETRVSSQSRCLIL